MVENLNEQDNGYIVIFLIHHTRSIILDCVKFRSQFCS